MNEKILARNYKKTFIIILILALALGAATGVAIPLSLRTQISEHSVMIQQMRQEYLRQTQNNAAARQGNAEYDFEDYVDDHEETWESEMTPLSATNYVVIGGLGVLWLALLVWYWATVMGWLYKSAVWENMNRSLWMILGGFFNVFAVLAFLIVRDRPGRKSDSEPVFQ